MIVRANPDKTSRNLTEYVEPLVYINTIRPQSPTGSPWENTEPRREPSE